MRPTILAAEQLASTEFIAFDTETTGLWAPSHRILEVAAIRFTIAGGIVDTFQELINPQSHIPKEVIRIHGITDQMVAGARTGRDVLSDFVKYCGGRAVLIAHNAPFDMSFLSCEFARCGLSLPQNPIIDTVTMARQIFPGLPSYSLLSLAKGLLRVSTQMHRALADADLVRQLFCLIADKIQAHVPSDGTTPALPILYLRAGQVEDVVLPDQFADILTAINLHAPLEIEYHSGGKEAQIRLVRPRRVFSRNDTLYLTGYCESARATRTFLLDRIRSCRLVIAQAK